MPVVVVQVVDRPAVVVQQPASPQVVTVAPGGGTGGGGGGGTGTAYPLLAVSVKTADYTLSAATDDVVLFDVSAASRVASLPPAASNNGAQFTVKKIDASTNTVTLDPNGAELVEGAATLVLTEQWEAATVVCNGVGWYLI
jgi:hypothetical protein